MPYPTSLPVLNADTIEASRLDLAPRILRLADGDSAFAAQIRAMMWGEYCSAGTPLGHSEEGMMVWWSEKLDDWSE